DQEVRLLVAEDHPSLARSLAEGLKEEGYAVDMALDGLEAERLIEGNRYGCIVLDIILPNRDGLTILKNLRGRGAQTPVLCVTAREFMLLHYLATRQGQVVSRTEISRHLYGQDDEASSNVVDVYIGYLRNKIDKPFEQKLIHTRRGAGYQMSATAVGAGVD